MQSILVGRQKQNVEKPTTHFRVQTRNCSTVDGIFDVSGKNKRHA